MRIHKKLAAILLASLGLCACSVSSDSYIAKMNGYSVTSGRFTQIENLHVAKIEPLADGVAMTLSRPGCRVGILFENDQVRVMEFGTGVVLVHAFERDYILQSQLGDAAETPAEPTGR